MTVQDLQRLSDVMRIALSDAEAERYCAVFHDWISQAERLKEWTPNPDAFEGAVGLTSLRSDVARRSFSQSSLLSLAPEVCDGSIVVPQILKEEEGGVK